MLKFVPNILTLGRLILSLVFLGMILYYPCVTDRVFFLDIAFAVFLLAGLTDIVDGPVARKLNVTSKFGRMMDPLVDKVLVCGAFICFAVIGQPPIFSLSGLGLALLHWFVAAVLVLREVYVTILRHAAEARGINFAATASGKIKMFIQSIAIATVIIKMAYVSNAAWGDWFTLGIFALMLIVTVASGLRATRRVRG